MSRPRKDSPVTSRGALFRRSDDAVAEAAPEEAPPAKRERIKRSYFVDPELFRELEDLQWRQYRETGTKPELSDLVSEGIRLLLDSRKATD